MQLTTQPEDGVAPVLDAIAKAKKSLDILIFRLDVKEVVGALQDAVARGVAVRALIAHTNKGGEKTLRKLEKRLLDAGATVSRSADELMRYHGKMMIIDGKRVHVCGFNFTWDDIDHSRSFSVVCTAPALVREAQRLFQADLDRQPYTNTEPRLVVSPANSRTALSAFIQGARRQLFIYDPNINDRRMLKLLADRVAAGVDVRIMSKSARPELNIQAYPGKRLHVRAMIRDGRRAFLGSQSLRALELDRRREVGVLIAEPRAVKKMTAVFEADWAQTDAGRHAAEDTADAPEADLAAADHL